MRRRQFLLSTGLAALGASTSPCPGAGRRRPAEADLYFTRSSGFQHSVVKRKGNELAHSERIMTEWGQKHGFDVECTKDGSVFDGDLNKYDAFAFYTTGVLTHADDAKKLASGDNGGTPPMSEQGKQRFLDAVRGGKGFIGFHERHRQLPLTRPQAGPGADVRSVHRHDRRRVHRAPCEQQPGTLKVIDGSFPGLSGLSAEITVQQEEWYSLKYFAKDLHVILLQLTKGMKGDAYQRPDFPQTWARMHGQGRVYYTSLGHREDVGPTRRSSRSCWAAWPGCWATPRPTSLPTSHRWPRHWVIPTLLPPKPAKPKNPPVPK